MTSPIVELNDDLQVLELWACWDSSPTHQAGSRWRFANVRGSITPAELVTFWRTYCEASYINLRPSGFLVRKLVVRDVWPGTADDYEYIYPDGGLYYPVAAQPTPANTSMIISWRTGQAGRSYRGRTFWGPCRASDAPSGTVVVNIDFGTEPIREFAYQMVTNFGGGSEGFTPGFCIMSEAHNGSPLAVPTICYVESYAVDPVLRTIRQRDDYPPEYSTGP